MGRPGGEGMPAGASFKAAAGVLLRQLPLDVTRTSATALAMDPGVGRPDSLRLVDGLVPCSGALLGPPDAGPPP